MISHIEPNWNISEFYDLDYFLTTHKDQKLLNLYEKSGHSKENMTLYNCHEPSFIPNCVYTYIKPKFEFLDNIAVAVNYFKPGQYLPIHTDIFGKYMKIYNVQFEKIVRYIIMLDNGSSGQILQIGDNTFSNWKSGDCFSWGSDVVHAFYNMSMKDRYAVQLTGTLK